MTVGERIKQLRKSNGYTQETLAKIIGASTGSVQQWERGVREPSFKMVKKLNDIFATDVTKTNNSHENVEKMTTGQRIRAAREKAGLSRKQVEQRAGIHVSEIGKWERGDRFPTLKTLARVAEAIGVDTTELLGCEVTSMYSIGETEQETYQELAARTIDKEMNAEQMLLHALHGMTSEIGEIHGIYQKRYQGHNIGAERVREETGDLLWFVAEFCTAHGWNMEDIMRENIEKLKKRYPDGFDPERSVNRAEYRKIICKSTGKPCIKCNPGACAHREYVEVANATD